MENWRGGQRIFSEWQKARERAGRLFDGIEDDAERELERMRSQSPEERDAARRRELERRRREADRDMQGFQSGAMSSEHDE